MKMIRPCMKVIILLFFLTSINRWKMVQRIVLRDHLVEVALNQYQGRQIILSLPEKVRSALELR